ncbi:MAG: beta-propeller domain-containing protein [Nanoarchaeota archaeon]|nr:beta-propeller domain-containing protein [Nanoarchaeota archaeon]
MQEKTKLFGILGICALLVIAILVFQSGIINFEKKKDSEFGSGELKKFSSYGELKDFVKERSLTSNNYGGLGFFSGEVRSGALDGAFMESKSADAAAPNTGSAGEFSQTNIQVEGVDEPDFVKNDGKYIYLVSKGRLFIIDAYPANEMRKLSETEFAPSQNNYGRYYGETNEIFVKGDKLVIFGTGYETIKEVGIESARCIIMTDGCYYQRIIPKTLIFVYDIKNKAEPKLEGNISIDGNYMDARLIGNYVYTVSQKEVNVGFDEEEVLPMIKENGVERSIPSSDIYYFDGSDQNFVFSIISSLNIENGNLDEEVYLTGRNGALYVSEDSVYLSSYTRKSQRASQEELLEEFVEEVLVPLLPRAESNEVKSLLSSDFSLRKKWSKIQETIKDYSDGLSKEDKAEFDRDIAEAFTDFERKFNRDLEKTVIHKIGVQNGKIEYNDKGEVYGRILNQFSLDQYKGDLRIATTTGDTWDGRSLNHIYVLGNDMKMKGSVENLAEGERIYSARFIGDRAYMVTFRQVDPLFVIDLKDSAKPKVLGYLKIPGYSDYLHPYDENHIIGIGKDTTESGLYQGLKIALFDVSDVTSPKERTKAIIGDRGSDSYALHEHKAFLFDKKRNLLVLPVSVAKINESRYDSYEEMPDWAYGDVVYRGAYAFNISDKGIVLTGKITHLSSDKSLDYGYDYEKEIRRSLFMDNTLYTISSDIIKANSLSDMGEIKSLELFENQIRNRGEIIY